MFLHLHKPGPPLDAFVELVTYYSDYQPDHTKERLLPDGAVEIIIDLTDSPKRLYHRDDPTKSMALRRAWISGMRKDWILIEAARGASMVVIRFRPCGAYPFLGFPVEGITDIVGQLDDVLDATTSSLRDRILEAPTAAAKMAAVEAWLVERARGRLATNSAVEYVAGQLFAPAGIRIRDVVHEIGYSQRHLLALFRRFVGLTPKQYGRIQRFQQVLRASVRASGQAGTATAPKREPDWADLALSHGYFDQAHLIRDFRQFSGLTPRAYLGTYRGLENYLPMD